MERRSGWDMKAALAVVWMIFTIALAVWLSIFASRLFHRIEALGTPEAEALLKHSRMVGLELGSLVLALILGGAGLLYLIWLERRRTDQIQSFFAVFSHELRTSLARLRLQAEDLQEDFGKNGRGGATLRLLDDVAKLEVQLDNSLWIARADEDRLLIEKIPLSKIMSELAPQFPLSVHVSSDATLNVDRRAVESIFKNLFQNAVLHGQAQNLWIDVSKETDRLLKLVVRDDGKGFHGNVQALGQVFRRHSHSSGSGLGLFLVQKLTDLHDGQVTFATTTQGFQAEITLPGER